MRDYILETKIQNKDRDLQFIIVTEFIILFYFDSDAKFNIKKVLYIFNSKINIRKCRLDAILSKLDKGIYLAQIIYLK